MGKKSKEQTNIKLKFGVRAQLVMGTSRITFITFSEEKPGQSIEIDWIVCF